MTKVVHCKKEAYDIRIDRSTKWGNPFIVGIDGTREEVIEKHRKYLLKNPIMLQNLHELKDKILGCWCKPKACHGDTYVEMLEKKNVTE